MDNILTSFPGPFISRSQTGIWLASELGLSINLSTPSGGTFMFQRTKICSGLLIAFGGLAALAPSAFAQDDQSVQRVEITGSSIKRIDAETSVPVTVLKADDLKKQGITTVEQILQSVAAVQIQTGTSQVVGSGS